MFEFSKKTHSEMIYQIPVNKAFHSLSFRGKRGYPTNIIEPRHMKRERAKSNIFGGILSIKCEDGETRYALVQGRYTGKWSFPKGHSNEGEKPIECTKREIAEETGIDELPEPTEYKQCGYGHYFVFNLEKQEVLIPRDKNEIMDTKWVTLEEMKSLSLNADASMFVKRQ
jgi:8-oxo-dGTP pyrophosphatase MutT (NUDIX family)